ncbi:MAG: conjugal transfer protein TraD [Acidithiobacillus sp.]|nr:conjugal transfer protein TraD [Acidithiobacillus sp.]
MSSQAEKAETRYLAALESAKRAKEILIGIREKQDRKKRTAARKSINHKRFLAGSLMEIAGLLETDEGLLLGGLMALAKTMNDPTQDATLVIWKQHGEAELAQRETMRFKKAINKTAEAKHPGAAAME